MAEAKTKPTGASVEKFLAAIEDPQQRADAEIVAGLMVKATRSPATMWGPSIVGFGQYRYVYASGREGDWPLVAFSPRKRDLTIYLMPGFDAQQDLLEQLGKHKTGKSCLYIKRLADIDIKVLNKLIRESVKRMKATYKTAK